MKALHKASAVLLALLLVMAGCAPAAPPPTPTKPPAAPPKPAVEKPVAPTPKPAEVPAKPALAVPEKTYELKLAGLMPMAHFSQKALQMLADRAQQMSQGKIKITTYLGGSLYKDKEEVEGLRSGAVDIASHTFSNWNAYVPATEIWDVPYLFPGGRDQMLKLLPELTKLFDEELQAKAGGKLLGWLDYGDLGGLGNGVRPIKNPEDLKGLKMRGFSRRAAFWQESLGSAAVVISSAEVYTALQRGTIDGAMSGTTTHTTRKWMEVEKHITFLPNIANMFFSVMMNKKKWDSLEPAAQQILLAATKEAQEWTIAQALAEGKAAVDELKKRPGLEFYQVPKDEELAKWAPTNKVAMEGFYKDAGPVGLKIKELIEKTK